MIKTAVMGYGTLDLVLQRSWTRIRQKLQKVQDRKLN